MFQLLSVAAQLEAANRSAVKAAVVEVLPVKTQ